jgi:hypothetical protein
MRNLQEYPITSIDIFDALRCADSLMDTESIGDTNRLSLTLLRLYLEDNKTSLNEFLNKHKIV